MPLIMALLGNPELSGMASKAMSGQKASDEAARLVKEAGGVEKAMRIARRFAEKAEGILGRLALHQRAELSAILTKTLKAGDFTAAKA
jgi:geranylgeranyl pyrophosphate synthase